MANEQTIIQLTDPAQWRSAYDHVLTACFPPVELESYETLHESLATEQLRAFGIVGTDGAVECVVMLAVYGPVSMILYLSIAPDRRGGGRGGALLGHAIEYARAADVSYVLAEIEHPAYHQAHPEFGDPAARLKFYERHGLRILDVPYFMPALGPGTKRVPALLLGALWTSADVHRGDAAVAAAPLREFLTRYVAHSEGSLATDNAMTRLLTSVSGDEVRLWSVSELAQVPAGLLEPDELYAPQS